MRQQKSSAGTLAPARNFDTPLLLCTSHQFRPDSGQPENHDGCFGCKALDRASWLREKSRISMLVVPWLFVMLLDINAHLNDVCQQN